MNSLVAVVFALIGYASSASQKTAREGCSIDLNHDLPARNEPLYLKKSGSSYVLIEPTVKNRQGVIELRNKEELILACPGKNNYLVETKKPSVSGFCVRNTTLSTDVNIKSTFTTQNAGCATPAQADIKVTSTRCSQIGKIYEIGFEANGWHLMISICHDAATSTTLFAKHQLKGHILQGAEHESRRPSFQKGNSKELYSGFDPDSYYKKKAQENVFKTAVGNGKVKNYYTDNGDFFFSRGHLAPDGDFIFGSEQFSTYFYVNVAPQWQVINAGNWQSVEKMVRQYAKNTKEELTILTGTYGVLELEDEKGKPQKFYLNQQKKSIPVPAYFWKVIYNSVTKQGIAFATSNNPYLKAGSRISFCRDACVDHNWMWFDSKKEFVNITRGLTTCCSFHELRKEVEHVPFLDVQGIIRGKFTDRSKN